VQQRAGRRDQRAVSPRNAAGGTEQLRVVAGAHAHAARVQPSEAGGIGVAEQRTARQPDGELGALERRVPEWSQCGVEPQRASRATPEGHAQSVPERLQHLDPGAAIRHAPRHARTHVPEAPERVPREVTGEGGPAPRAAERDRFRRRFPAHPAAHRAVPFQPRDAAATGGGDRIRAAHRTSRNDDTLRVEQDHLARRIRAWFQRAQHPQPSERRRGGIQRGSERHPTGGVESRVEPVDAPGAIDHRDRRFPRGDGAVGSSAEQGRRQEQREHAAERAGTEAQRE